MKEESLSPRARGLLWQRTITREVKALAKANREAVSRLDRLNGSVDAFIDAKPTLERLVALAPRLERVAEQLNPDVITQISQLATEKHNDDIFWAGLKRRLNPLKPLGAGIWAILLTLLGAAAYAHFS